MNKGVEQALLAGGPFLQHKETRSIASSPPPSPLQVTPVSPSGKWKGKYCGSFFLLSYLLFFSHMKIGNFLNNCGKQCGSIMVQLLNHIFFYSRYQIP